ncbi:DMT family transporter [Chelativorans sp. Marseille-P2723]|uniref:DMT family transporter n=1 Tax=Chelativorans sp. Marseille-P2723 TaxID=2709133 RepID=UPI00156E8CFF|nr:DMT family transporter [Chelativorans sp. Marseille-P2723]
MHYQAYALLLAATLLWGANAVAGKLAVGHISPFLLTSLRWLVALTIIVPLGWPWLRREWHAIRRALPILILLGATGFTLFNVLLYTAVYYTSAINVSIEQAAIPMVIILFNFILFGVRASWLQILGFLLSLLGIALTATHGNLARIGELDFNFGDLLMLVAVLVYGVYTLALRFKPEINWMSMMTMLAVVAFLTSVPFTLWEHAAGGTIMPDMRGWLLVFFSAFFPSLLAQTLFIRGNELIGANRAGLFINLVPVFGTLLSIVIVGENFHVYHAIAIVFVFCGIWLAEWSGRKQKGAVLAT